MRATSACPGLSPTRTCSQIIVEAREHYVQIGHNLVYIDKECVIVDYLARRNICEKASAWAQNSL